MTLGPGQKSLDRGSTFKVPRAPMRRKRRRPSKAELAESRQFHLVSRGKACVVCRIGTAWWSHHVVYRQHCPPGRKWEVADALAVCDPCHHAHHSPNGPRIPRVCLSEANLNFASDVLGESAGRYLATRYS